jgi:hypothetical protein
MTADDVNGRMVTVDQAFLRQLGKVCLEHGQVLSLNAPIQLQTNGRAVQL